MYSQGEYFMTVEFKTVNKNLWHQVFHKEEHHQKRKESGVTYCAASSNRKDDCDLSIVFKYDKQEQMSNHSQLIQSLINDNREKWSAIVDLDTIKFTNWKILCERINDIRFEQIMNKSDDVFWMARHAVDDKEKWVTALKAQEQMGLNYDVRWWGVMENVDNPDEVCCCYRFPRDRWFEFVLNFTESIPMLREIAGIQVNTLNVKYVNIEFETMYNEPETLKKMKSGGDDRQQIEKIVNDMCNVDHTIGKHHMHDNCLIIRPSGNPLNMTQWDEMMNNKDVNVESNDLVSINKLHVNGNMAYVCYTTHGKFNYKGTENDDIAVLTSVLEKIDGKWVVVHGQRSTGRKPSEQPPQF